ncbi:hypothetical protein PTSG_12170 [Salpingoeca rosetta]|uniref:FAD-binding FR-type domain-containing protein n=1 Tax=Salpingoeca rosetta (strain ATCC 50818 / BSB-021) TaxID=946362 RepID=F2U8H2_SALR5|nr:uncharacterized protein PTSG_12170 [Salpingoeca rosetta]EGD72680.1 hypothetical protein PTSG_12170 [Salpingoeca rosetta]|eukprot:XP_004994503.1 hypothetical protein PTSG_12170 [Salpingoeca rosetta]
MCSCTATIHAFRLIRWFHTYYACGGLGLWLLDRCIRIVRRCDPVTISSVTVNKEAGVTVLQLAKANFTFYAGQYIWLNVPCISHMEWHPFTVSSPPSADKLTLHVKNMGPNTFTAKLMWVTDTYPLEAIKLRVDGPYGRPLYFDEVENLILVAGGIGVTPMHSILMEIYNRARAGMDVGRIKTVTLVWAVRQAELLHMFNDMQEVARDNFVQVKFDFSFHITGAASYASLGPSSRPGEHELVDVVSSFAKAGRPDLMTVGGGFSTGRNTMVMVCGPEQMITAASDMAAYYDFAFHHEVFTF